MDRALVYIKDGILWYLPLFPGILQQEPEFNLKLSVPIQPLSIQPQLWPLHMAIIQLIFLQHIYHMQGKFISFDPNWTTMGVNRMFAPNWRLCWKVAIFLYIMLRYRIFILCFFYCWSLSWTIVWSCDCSTKVLVLL